MTENAAQGPASSTRSPARVVVGNDGSQPALDAMAWALRHAAATGATVTVLRGWSISTAPRPSTWTTGYVPPIEDFEAAVLEDLRKDVADAVAEHGADVEVSYETHHGPAGEGLLKASQRADLLVVAARGRGGFLGLTLGSVTDQLVRHAACPVVVVRGAHSSETGRTRSLDQVAGQGE